MAVNKSKAKHDKAYWRRKAKEAAYTDKKQEH